MSFFSRIRDTIRSVFVPSAEHQRFDEAKEEVNARIDSVGLGDVWRNSVTDNLNGQESQYGDFVLDDNAAEVFERGFIEGDPDAMEEFFDLMEDYDISRDEFDWDSWRDWYEPE